MPVRQAILTLCLLSSLRVALGAGEQDADWTYPLSISALAKVDRITAVFTAGAPDPEKCLAEINRIRAQISVSDGRHYQLQGILWNQFPRMATEQIFKYLSGMTDPGGVLRDDVLSDRCAKNHAEQKKWVDYAISLDGRHQKQLAEDILAVLWRLEPSGDLSQEARDHIVAHTKWRSSNREGPDLDDRLRQALQSFHRAFEHGRINRRDLEDAIRNSVQIQGPQKTLPFVQEMAELPLDEKFSSLPGSREESLAFYVYLQIALGAEEPGLYQRINESISVHATKRGRGHFNQETLLRIQLLRSGYNPLLYSPFPKGELIPEPVMTAHEQEQTAFICSCIREGTLDLARIKEIVDETRPSNDWEWHRRRSIIATLLHHHLLSLPADERLNRLSDGRLFPLLSPEGMGDIFPNGKGDDAEHLTPWVEAISRCPHDQTRSRMLLTLLRGNRPNRTGSAGTTMVIDHLPSLDGVDSSLLYTPHRRLPLAIDKQLDFAEGLLMSPNADVSGHAIGGLMHLMDCLRGTRRLVPADEVIARLDLRFRSERATLLSKACFALGCRLLGSTDPKYREALRAFLLSPPKPPPFTGLDTSLKDALSARALLLERGINCLEVAIGY